MFFRNKLEVSNLKVKLEDANANVERLKAELLRVKSNEDTSKATMSIDFNKIKCFSVERNESYAGRPCTILGYNLLTDAENTGPREWTLYCSAEQHERIVDAFNKQKGK
jgi:predicted RNase H-like nuclease (RuvC/YqgF family)